MNDENFLVIDWRGSLSGSLASRFIVDKKSGNLIVSGDSGDCIAHWHSSITPKGVEISVNYPMPKGRGLHKE